MLHVINDVIGVRIYRLQSAGVPNDEEGNYLEYARLMENLLSYTPLLNCTLLIATCSQLSAAFINAECSHLVF